MRILLISSLYQPYVVGGAERVVQNLAEGMLARGLEVEVLTTAPDGHERSQTVNGVPVEFVRVRNLYYPFAKNQAQSMGRKLLFHAIDSWNPVMAAVVQRKIRTFHPDVINSHNIAGFSPAVLGAAQAERTPIAHTLHDQYLLCPKTTMFRTDNCVRQCLSCKPYGLLRSRQAVADLVIGVSEFILERHRQFGVFRHSPMRVIHNAAPLRPVGASPHATGSIRFGFLGQIRPTKGLHILVNAFLAENLANAELHIAGRGDQEYEARLRDLTADRPNIHWVGFVDSTAFMDSIDILVVPSLWNDTAPLVLLEAYAASRPVMASCRGGIPEFVTSKTGWIFDPDDPSQLRTLLRKCCEYPNALHNMGKQAKAVAEHHNMNKFLDDYEQAYTSVRSQL